MITRLVWTIWTPMSSVPKKANKLNLSLSFSGIRYFSLGSQYPIICCSFSMTLGPEFWDKLAVAEWWLSPCQLLICSDRSIDLLLLNQARDGGGACSQLEGVGKRKTQNGVLLTLLCDICECFALLLLNYWHLVMPYGIMEISQHWFR